MTQADGDDQFDRAGELESELAGTVARATPMPRHRRGRCPGRSAAIASVEDLGVGGARTASQLHHLQPQGGGDVSPAIDRLRGRGGDGHRIRHRLLRDRRRDARRSWRINGSLDRRPTVTSSCRSRSTSSSRCSGVGTPQTISPPERRVGRERIEDLHVHDGAPGRLDRRDCRRPRTRTRSTGSRTSTSPRRSSRKGATIEDFVADLQAFYKDDFGDAGLRRWHRSARRPACLSGSCTSSRTTRGRTSRSSTTIAVHGRTGWEVFLVTAGGACGHPGLRPVRRDLPLHRLTRPPIRPHGGHGWRPAASLGPMDRRRLGGVALILRLGRGIRVRLAVRPAGLRGRRRLARRSRPGGSCSGRPGLALAAGLADPATRPPRRSTGGRSRRARCSASCTSATRGPTTRRSRPCSPSLAGADRLHLPGARRGRHAALRPAPRGPAGVDRARRSRWPGSRSTIGGIDPDDAPPLSGLVLVVASMLIYVGLDRAGGPAVGRTARRGRRRVRSAAPRRRPPRR